jgi:hypothetical protein
MNVAHSLAGLTVAVLLAFRSAEAYDLRTHGNITEQSFDASQGVRRYLEETAIAPNDVFDPPRIAPPWQLGAYVNDGTARGWMAEGTLREDDYKPHALLETSFGCDPPRNPPSLIDRPVNHFFDVQRGGAGLTSAGGLPAPDWALGLQGRGTDTDQNQFSLPDARVYQFRSLTGSGREERDRNTALLFRTLGQVIHLVQDMAQPQHTRNDPHLGCDSELLQFVAGERSWYERYVETRALNERYRTRSDPSRPLVLSGYAPVALRRYRDYWVNADGSGLAEFSSRNFFTAGTNLGTFALAGPCGGLSQPVCEPQAYRTEDLDFAIPTLAGGTLSGRVRFFLRDIADPLSGQVVQNVRVSSRSLWDQHLETNQRRPRFSLNTYNYDSMADILVPRAVGYSAGLLDHYFRGRLTVDLVMDPDDSSALKLVGALVDDTSLAKEPVAGTLALYWDDAHGVRSPVPGFAPLALTGVAGDAIASPSFPPPEGAERFVAVYQGLLGQEQGAVVGRVGIGAAGVEELFIDDATGDLYLRNRAFLTRLAVREQLTPAGAALGCVIWGNDRVSFMVSVVPDRSSSTCGRSGAAFEWAIFELSARPAGTRTWLTPPTARLVRQETFDMAWTAAVGAGLPDQVFTVVLDSRRHILYGGLRGRNPDPFNYQAGVLVNQSTRTTLIDYGIAIIGEFGGGSAPYLVHADGAHLDESVAVVKSWAFLDRKVWGVNRLTPFRTAVWVGGSERVLHADVFGAPMNHELIEKPFRASIDPVWPHSTRQHVLYSVLFTDAADPINTKTVTRVYLHQVSTGVSRVVAEDPGPGPTAHVDLLSKYDLRGSANSGVDRLFQASRLDLLDGAAPLPEVEREQFMIAWDPTTGAPLLDVTAADYPPLDVAAKPLARLVPLPADQTYRTFPPPAQSRAIQVVE